MRHITSFDFGDARIPWKRIPLEKESMMIKELRMEVLDKMESLGLM